MNKVTIALMALAICIPANAGLVSGPGESFDELTLTGTQGITLAGGTGNRLTLEDWAILDMLSGKVARVWLWGNSVATISGGLISERLYVGGNSFSTIEGGAISSLMVASSGKVILSGGTVSSINLSPNHGPSLSITLICDLDSLVQTYDGGTLVRVSGDWLDGSSSSFDIGVVDGAGSYMHFVPEPATLALLALGGLALRRKKNVA